MLNSCSFLIDHHLFCSLNGIGVLCRKNRVCDYVLKDCVIKHILRGKELGCKDSSSLILYLCLILPLLYPLHIFFICNSLPCCHLLLLTCTCSLGLHNIPVGVKCFSTDAFSCRCFPYSTSIFPYSISSLFFHFFSPQVSFILLCFLCQ